VKLKQNGKTINSYFIFIILLLLVIFGLNLLNNRTDEYTKAEFIADLDAGNVSEVVVQPNGEAPTGYLEIHLISCTQRTLQNWRPWYVSMGLIRWSMTLKGRTGS